MRELIIICIISLAFAAPHPYRYSIRQPHRQYGPATAISATFFQKDIQSSNNLFLKQHHQSPAYQTSNDLEQFTQLQSPAPPVAHYLAPIQAAEPFDSNHLQQPNDKQFEQKSAEPAYLVTKRFYIHSAPEEDDEEETLQRSITIGKPRKNFNVVFIRAPSKSTKKTSLKIIPAINEEKTVIYVLAKKTDDAEIDAHVLEPATTTTKPEVFFIKYKTPEEAEHAQQRIQAEYDGLGGSTQVTNEGVSKVTSVIGSLDAEKRESKASELAQEEDEVLGAQNSSAAVNQLQSTLEAESGYLPPLKYYHKS